MASGLVVSGGVAPAPHAHLSARPDDSETSRAGLFLRLRLKRASIQAWVARADKGSKIQIPMFGDMLAGVELQVRGRRPGHGV